MNEPLHRRLKSLSADFDNASHGFYRADLLIPSAYMRALQMLKILVTKGWRNVTRLCDLPKPRVGFAGKIVPLQSNPPSSDPFRIEDLLCPVRSIYVIFVQISSQLGNTGYHQCARGLTCPSDRDRTLDLRYRPLQDIPGAS